MDRFVQETGVNGCTDPRGRNLVMDYYDGNTVTALWNYAQHFALSDNSYGTNYGPSTPGAINLISGNTHGVNPPQRRRRSTGTLTGDPNPMSTTAAAAPRSSCRAPTSATS